MGRIQFGQALFEAYDAHFPNGPRSSRKAGRLVQSVTAWLNAHPLPVEPPDGGWGHWMVGVAGDDPVPAPSADCTALLHALDDLVEAEQDFGRYLSQITPLARDRALAESPGVRIMTMIGSKGLTVRATIIAGLDDGIVPRPDEGRRRGATVALRRNDAGQGIPLRHVGRPAAGSDRARRRTTRACAQTAQPLFRWRPGHIAGRPNLFGAGLNPRRPVAYPGGVGAGARPRRSTQDEVGPSSEPDDPRQQARLPREQRVERCQFAFPRDVPGEHIQHALDKTPHQVDRDGIDLCSLATDTQRTLLGRKEADDNLARRQRGTPPRHWRTAAGLRDSRRVTSSRSPPGRGWRRFSRPGAPLCGTA